MDGGEEVFHRHPRLPLQASFMVRRRCVVEGEEDWTEIMDEKEYRWWRRGLKGIKRVEKRGRVKREEEAAVREEEVAVRV